MPTDDEEPSLHPITKLFGDIGAAMFGFFGMMYVGTIVGPLPRWSILLEGAILGLALFIIGFCTIPIHIYLKTKFYPESVN